MKLSDFKGLLKTHNLELISVSHPGQDYFVVKLKNDSDIEWIPGQHGIFTIPGSDFEGKKWRAFSVASISDEGFVEIAFRTGEKISNFKNYLINMKPGEIVKVRGPFGWFYLQDEYSPIVMIATGVGVTPFRALMKELEKGNKRDVEVIYSAKDFHLFGDELELIAAKDPKINLNLTNGSKETKEKIIEVAKKFGNSAYYFISGKPEVIKSVRQDLSDNEISTSRMINDSFKGY